MKSKVAMKLILIGLLSLIDFSQSRAVSSLVVLFREIKNLKRHTSVNRAEKVSEASGRSKATSKQKRFLLIFE